MAKLTIRPPRVNISGKGGFWRQIGMIVIGTTISLVLTIATAQLMERHQRAKDRRLSAMMVMSNIESFARLLDENAAALTSSDSIATWLLNKPIEDLEQLPEEELNGMIDQVTSMFFLSYDKSAENIFSNNIETWKNMGNVQFIDLVGQCFSAMNQIEEYWTKRANDVNAAVLDIKNHPENYEGSTKSIKILRSEMIRQYLKGIPHLRAWLSYSAATLRYHNRSNMKYIDITEEEVMVYTNFREQGIENPDEEPQMGDFFAPVSPDSLTTMRQFDSLLEQSMDRHKGR